nr:hypothetical protein [Tanacetum cinerariifolium]
MRGEEKDLLRRMLQTQGVDQGEDLLVGDTMKDSDKSADKGSDSTDEMSHVLGSLRAANILASGGLRSVFTTAGLSVATASTNISPIVATASGCFPTAAIFTTDNVATPTTRVTRSSRGVVIGSSSLIYVNIPSISKKDKGKGKMTEPEQPSKEKVLEQMSIQLARDLEAKFAQEYIIIKEQAKRDYEIARIHAEKELKMMITELDRSNEMVAKYLSEYKQAAVGCHMMRREDLDKLWSLVKETCSTTEVIDEKAKEFWVELKKIYEPDFRDPVWALQRLSVPTADVYFAKKLTTVEEFARLHEDKIYSESKTRIDSSKRYSSGGVIDLTGDEDPTDEDGDTGMND